MSLIIRSLHVSYMILREREEGEPATIHWKASLNSPSIVERKEIYTQSGGDQICVRAPTHTAMCINLQLYIYNLNGLQGSRL